MKGFIVKYAGLLSVIWFLLIFLACSTPGQYVPSASWMDLLSFDKFVHAGIFFILVFLLTVYAIRVRMKLYGVTVLTILCVLYGGILEIMQATLFSHRSSDWRDFVANSFGCFIAWLFYKTINKKFFRTNISEKQSATDPEQVSNQ